MAVALSAPRSVLARFGLLATLGLLLAGCSSPVFEREETRPCPPVRMEATTADLTRFRPGPGRDLTDVVLEAELTGYQGECQYDDDARSVRVDLVLAFSASLGPAAMDRQQTFKYYVAIPRFYPDPKGKQVFESTIVFPDGMDRVRYVGEELSIEVPLGADGSAAEIPLYIGFQLSPEQIEYNRAHATGSR